MVPARSSAASHGVIDNRSENLQHLQWGRSPSLAQRCGGCGTERSAEIGRFNHTRCPHARARGARRFQASSEADRNLHRPAGRRCGCWSTSPLLFSGIVVRRFWGGRWSSGSAPMLTSASPGRAAAMVPAPVERSQPRGHRNRSENLQHLQWGRSPSLAQRCGGCGTERSSEFGRFNHDSLPSRARANNRETRRPLTNRRPGLSFSTKSPIPTNGYASAIGLCKDSIIMQSRKPSNSDF